VITREDRSARPDRGRARRPSSSPRDGRPDFLLVVGFYELLDATLRLAFRLENPAPAQIADALASLDTQPPPAPLTNAAPVLMLPGVLEATLCARLIEAFQSDHFESGMPRAVAGELRLLPDPAVKRRSDHLLEDAALVDAVTERIVERLLPDIVSTFHYEVTHLEGFKVARYDAGQRGFFRAHRDNCTPDAQHRRFAMTLNLNDDYEGGALSFPEFGPQRYRPPAGGALVFSGNMLHEAGEVTAGQRFVLLTFMWGAR
jgi:predicted 2-oxoglutarate/Fe(II)-dependent dioxygenase YbiX